MKQTFVQRFRSGHPDNPIARKDIARALQRIVNQLNQPHREDPEPRVWPILPHHSFELEGYGDTHGQIRLTIQTPR